MNLAFVINQLIIGGAEQYVITKSDWLIKKGYNIIVVSEGGVWKDKLPNKVIHYELKGLMTGPHHFEKKEYDTFLSKLSSILKDNHIDIIEGQNTWPIIHVANSYQIHKIPFYMNILSEVPYNRNPLLQNLTCNLSKLNLYYTLTYKMNDYIEAKCKSKLNPNIINIPIKNENKSSIEDSNYVLSVCRMSKEKMYVKSLIVGFCDLVDCNKEIKQNLIIVGEGEYFNEIKNLAKKCNEKLGQVRIIIKGSVIGKELIDLFSKCTIYVGMGITLLTAASFQKPCVRCGFESSTMDMAWGFWGDDEFSDRDEIVYMHGSLHSEEEEFRGILERSLNDSRLRIDKGRKANAVFNKYYSLTTIMSKWDHEYHRILENNLLESNQLKLEKISRKSRKMTNLIRSLYKIKSMIKKSL